ncbi:MAG: hypothetical protein QGH74_02225 [Candidatus Brocadiia bacterium]|jgi:hypothetical protein|nr:hypothetical protein [Candidatus Brocadiia bacterium]
MSKCTVVLSRAPDGRRERRRFEDAVAGVLQANGCAVLVVPHIYYLTDSHPATVRLAQLPGDTVVAAWLHPRATHWTLKALGMSEERALHCFDLGAFESVDACVAGLRRASGAGAAGDGCVEELAGPAPERWYPVVDYARCAACRQCLDFCLFGVYSVEGGRVVASRPEGCRPGCPACARVCPNAAIMFPHYADDPAIAGAPGADISGGTVDVEAFFRAAGKGEPCPECARGCDCEELSPVPTRPIASAECARACDCEERDDLDDLIDELDKLDE